MPGDRRIVQGGCSKRAGIPVWQRNHYEHVVRGEDDLNRIAITSITTHSYGRWKRIRNTGELIGTFDIRIP